MFEAPVGLIDRQVELRFHPEDLSQVEVFFQGKSYGIAPVVNVHVNAKIGRNWDPNPETLKPKLEQITVENKMPTGQLFINKNEEVPL